MFIFLDTEITGTAEEDRLCQLAYKTETGVIVNDLQWLSGKDDLDEDIRYTVGHYLNNG